jgi:23S rRNA G2069 N7-methylase RlmK/C1962 C5-methylase RlmI
MQQGDLVRVIKNDMSLAFNAKTKMKDRKFFHKLGIILDVYHDIKLVRYNAPSSWRENEGIQHIWYDVYFGSTGIYHVREDVMVVESESR